jgi:hypothetical protein
MNPRDTELEVMTNVKIHRVIRHGTIYGSPPPENVMEDDGKDRGVFFIFLSAKAPETFEFLKRKWINSGNFLGLGAEEDPIAGVHAGTGMFTIPLKPFGVVFRVWSDLLLHAEGSTACCRAYPRCVGLQVLRLSEQQPLRAFQEERDGRRELCAI